MAEDLHGYTNPELSQALLEARAFIGIITGLLRHPVRLHFDRWMESAGKLTHEKHATDFARKFFDIPILPGDAALIEQQTEYVLEVLGSEIALGGGVADGLSMEMLRRVITIAPLLFQLVIFRIYLRRTLADDEHSYFLTRGFDKGELADIKDGDPLSDAKRGKVVRNLMVPETVLQSVENPFGERHINACIPAIPVVQVGIRTAKTANARISARFVLANAYDVRGQDYLWLVE
ncbi:hypothetical protein B0H19DRAFT_1324556 [Mycena capillaripes]|nr:hypothetical protein B0H19DRAFT_1324556 [Mycena capillaripes]